MKTAIMTDTNSGITVEEGNREGIFVLPMPVIIDNDIFLEGINITHEKLYDAMNKDQDIRSSQPSPGELIDMWEKIFDEGYEEIVYIPMSSGLSGSCHSAMRFAEEYDGKVVVVDNHRISVTLYASVYDALHMAQNDESAKTIKQELEKNAYQSSIYITVNSLKYLRKSGRVTAAGAAIASVINLKPVLTIQGEKLDAFAKVRGMNLSKKKMLEAIRNDINTRFTNNPSKLISIGAAGTFEQKNDANEWFLEVQQAFPEYKVYYRPLSCSIACHVGQNAVGIGVSCINQ